MLVWMTTYSGLIQAAVSAVSAIVWIIYLRIFLNGYLRQQRSMMLVTSGAGRGINSHCLVTNLGLEPIYLLNIIIELTDDNGSYRAVIPERNELITAEGSEDLSATNQGPMTSGSLRDIGRFRSLIRRAAEENHEIDPEASFSRIEVTVVAVAASTSQLTAASRLYHLPDRPNGALVPDDIIARQHHGRRARRNLQKILRQELPERRR